MADDTRRVRRDRSDLDVPRRRGQRLPGRPRWDDEAFGRLAERFARFMGTGRFLVYMTTFVTVWLLWNTLLPDAVQFDPRELNFTLLTLILSLQASYAAPLILLAQNRQADRDRVTAAQDRAEQARNLADTEFITREVAALKIALREVATRDFLRSELRAVLEDLDERAAARERDDGVGDRDGGGTDEGPRGRDVERRGRAASARPTG
jgi:uncharacterized membrane protein